MRAHGRHLGEGSEKYIKVLGPPRFGMWRGVGVLHVPLSRPAYMTYHSWFYGMGRFTIEFVPDLTAYWDFIKEGKLPHGFAEATYQVLLVPEDERERAFLESIGRIFVGGSGGIVALLVPEHISDEIYRAVGGDCP